LLCVMNPQLDWGLTWKHLSGIKASFEAHTLYNCASIIVNLATTVVLAGRRMRIWGLHPLVKLVFTL